MTVSKNYLKNILLLLAGLAIFIGLVFFNYFKAQQAIKDERPAPLSLNLVSFPESLKAGDTATFIWHIESSPDLITSFTTIYWGYESTPSALTTLDSPQAVGYPFSQVDYTKGVFTLPLDFDLRIKFDRAGKVFYRAYAFVQGKHLWTPEKTLLVIK